MKKRELKARVRELEYELRNEQRKLDRVIQYLSNENLQVSAQDRLAELELGVMDDDSIVTRMKQDDRVAARACKVVLKRAIAFAISLKEM